MKKKILSGMGRGLVPAVAALFFCASCSFSDPTSASLANSGFDSGDTGWTLEGDAEIRESALFAQSGTHYLYLPVTANDGAYAEQVFPIVMGTKNWLDYSFYVRRTGPGDGAYGFRIEFYNANDQLLKTSSMSGQRNLDYELVQSGTSLPGGTVQGKIRLFNRTTGTSPSVSILYIDTVALSLCSAVIPP